MLTKMMNGSGVRAKVALVFSRLSQNLLTLRCAVLKSQHQVQSGPCEASTRPGHHFNAHCQRCTHHRSPPKCVAPQPRGPGGPQQPRASALLPHASALLQAPKRAGPQQRRANALLQAHTARLGAASLGRRGRFAVGVAAGGLRFFFRLRFFFLSSFSCFHVFSASRSAAFTLPLAASLKFSM